MGRLCFVNAWRWLQLIHSNRMPSTWLMRVKLNLLLPITPINFISFCYTDALLIIGSRGNWGVCCRFLFYLEGREWGKNFLLLYDWLPLCRFFISLVTRHLSNPPLPTPHLFSLVEFPLSYTGFPSPFLWNMIHRRKPEGAWAEGEWIHENKTGTRK